MKVHKSFLFLAPNDKENAHNDGQGSNNADHVHFLPVTQHTHQVAHQNRSKTKRSQHRIPMTNQQ